MEVEVAPCSEREIVMACIWTKCQSAWAHDEVERAQNLNRMYEALTGMTDEEYRDASTCQAINCECSS